MLGWRGSCWLRRRARGGGEGEGTYLVVTYQKKTKASPALLVSEPHPIAADAAALWDGFDGRPGVAGYAL